MACQGDAILYANFLLPEPERLRYPAKSVIPAVNKVIELCIADPGLVKTPVLLIVGTDNEPNATQAKEVFSALRHLGRRAEIRLYHDEGHFTNAWSLSNSRDLCQSVLGWFDRFLKAPIMPEK